MRMKKLIFTRRVSEATTICINAIGIDFLSNKFLDRSSYFEDIQGGTYNPKYLFAICSVIRELKKKN